MSINKSPLHDIWFNPNGPYHYQYKELLLHTVRTVEIYLLLKIKTKVCNF